MSLNALPRIFDRTICSTYSVQRVGEFGAKKNGHIRSEAGEQGPAWAFRGVELDLTPNYFLSPALFHSEYLLII